MKKIICKILEHVFPGETNRIKAERRAKRDAMQELLDVSRKMRERGFCTNTINDRLDPALKCYKRGRYERAKDYAHSPIFTCIAI